MSEIPEFPEPRDEKVVHTVRSLRELIDIVTGKNFQPSVEPADSGLAEILPFPFLALVGQEEMKLALLLSIINPLVNGVLLIGPRGTGKTTAVRSLIHLLPDVERSNCFLGCLPEDIEAGGIDAVCPDCARKYAEQWTFPGGSSDNRLHFGPNVHFAGEISEMEQMLLFDAQTSGGLLLAVSAEKLSAFKRRAAELDQPVWVLGSVSAGSGIKVAR